MRLRNCPFETCSITIVAASLWWSSALAQAPVSIVPQRTLAPIDQRQAVAQAAFEALAEQDRKAIQTDLIWVTDFSGATSGNFGSLTYRALQDFERLIQASPDGILNREERKALAESAAKARTAVRFFQRTDSRSKVRIGLPEILVTRNEANAQGGTRWQTTDRKITLDTFVSGSETLEQQFARASDAGNPARKVTYKLLRPDFFVVTGETATGKFYRRVVKTDTGISGFAIGYDKAMAAQWDRLTIAIANSFEATPALPVPSPAAPGAASTPGGSNLTLAAAASLGTAASVKLTEPRVFARSATGIVIADGKLLVATAGLVDCRNPTVRGAAFGPVIREESSGLGIASVQGLRHSGQVPVIASGKTEIVMALAHAEQSGGTTGLLAIPVTSHAERMTGAFQPGSTGAALFNTSGHLAGLLISDPGIKLQIAGTVVARHYAIADATQIRQFLERERITFAMSSETQAMSTGQMVAGIGSTIVAVNCSP
jgi:hypothetical protein